MTNSIFDLPLFNLTLALVVVVGVCVATYQFMNLV